MSDTYNPFAVQSPEEVPAQDALDLFVPVFSDFPKLLDVGNTFVHGPRGSGKSMMFRIMQPDCQILKSGTPLRELPYLGVYVPIKQTDLKLTELGRLERQHASLLLNEHFLTLVVTMRTFGELRRLRLDSDERAAEELRSYYHDVFIPSVQYSGWEGKTPEPNEEAEPEKWFAIMENVCEQVYRDLIKYLRKLTFAQDAVPYSGPICGYLDFFLPIAKSLRHLEFMPRGPLFLLIDDADNLNLTQTKVLNSWVSSRTSSDVSLKISTQLNYKTWLTAAGNSIAAPHDYLEVNIASVYTSSKNRYKERVDAIVQKRLTKAGVERTPDDFFPPDEEQEAAIETIGAGIRERFEESGRGNRPSDDVTRYARPTFIAELKGTSKSGSTYSYAGFDQLVHVSSGIVRFFLEAASLMYGEMQARHPDRPILNIDPAVQDRVVRDQAEEFLHSEFAKVQANEGVDSAGLDLTQRLRNLIESLGGYFHKILISDSSERRVFSVALSNSPDPDITEVFRLGVRYGYFHEKTIGNKEGTGRTPQYILSRRLAPYFLLDPTSFAGYKFITNEALREAMAEPKRFLRTRSITDSDDDEVQMNLFAED